MTRISRAACVLRVVVALALPIVATTCTSQGAESDKKAERTWGTAVESQALSIATEKATYAPGERIVLNAYFKNVGQKNVEVVLTNPLQIYHTSVLLPDGKPAPLTLFGKGAIASASVSARTVKTLKPGE